jgi:hypothetical protein
MVLLVFVVVLPPNLSDWDEFSTYMMAGGNNKTEKLELVFDDRIQRMFSSPHKDMIIRIDYLVKERKYVSVGYVD